LTRDIHTRFNPARKNRNICAGELRGMVFAPSATGQKAVTGFYWKFEPPLVGANPLKISSNHLTPNDFHF
jgi:hypothetical protein